MGRKDDMLTQEIVDKLSKRSGVDYVNNSGRLLSNTLNCVKGVYDFTKVGGAVGSFNLVDDDGLAVVLPSGALIVNAFAFAKVAATSGGSATIALNSEGAGDLLAATAVASFSLSAKLQGVPDFGTLGDSILTTAARNLQATVAVAALTAGKIYVYVFYILT